MEEIGLPREVIASGPSSSKVAVEAETEAERTEEASIHDMYIRMKELQRELEFVEIQETYIKDEQKNLKRELLRAQEEVKRIQSVPLVIGQFLEMVKRKGFFLEKKYSENSFMKKG
jgi:26S proteasome regulatory subunit T3